MLSITTVRCHNLITYLHLSKVIKISGHLQCILSNSILCFSDGPVGPIECWINGQRYLLQSESNVMYREGIHIYSEKLEEKFNALI